MGCAGGHSSPLLIGDVADTYLRKLYSRVKHLPIFSEICGKQSEETQLQGIHDHCLCIFLRPDKFVNAHHPANVIDIAKDDDIVLETILLSNFRVQLIDIDLVVQPMAQLDEVIRACLFPDIVLPIV